MHPNGVQVNTGDRPTGSDEAVPPPLRPGTALSRGDPLAAAFFLLPDLVQASLKAGALKRVPFAIHPFAQFARLMAQAVATFGGPYSARLARRDDDSARPA